MSLPLPIYFEVPTLSCVGTMLFPDDEAKAKAFAAIRLMRPSAARPGLLAELRASGSELTESVRLDLESTIGRNLLREDEVAQRFENGQMVGEVVKILWAMVCSEPRGAGWKTACRHVEEHAGSARGSVSTLQQLVTGMASVLHLWGAWSIRGRRFFHASDDAMDELWRFTSEAEILLQRLRVWRDLRSPARQDQDRRLSVEEFGIRASPWPGEIHPDASIPVLSIPVGPTLS